VTSTLSRRAFAEALGTALLAVAVVGSGTAAQRLSPGDVGLQLLESAVSTAGALVAMILAVGPVSGAHLNPVVTLAARAFRSLGPRDCVAYVTAQVGGAAIGAMLANIMFSLPAVELSAQDRSSAALWSSEVVATFGLLLVVFGVVRSGRPSAAPFAVGAYIGGAFFFTSSTSFANPALTVARALSDTLTGIAPGSVPGFVLAELAGALLALGAVRLLYPAVAEAPPDLVVPHPPERAAAPPSSTPR
jgi:arsenate reductase